jgi:translation initiation factor 3 subunit C
MLTQDSADQEFGKLLEILENTKEIVVIENAEEWEDDEKLPPIAPGEIFRIPGSVVSFAERLDDELTRSLQHIDPHTAEYVERLTDEALLYAQLLRALIYVEGLKKNASLELPQESLNRVVMRRLEHVYFKVSLTASLHFTLANASAALSGRYNHGGEQLEGHPRQPRLRSYSPRHLERHHLPCSDS